MGNLKWSKHFELDNEGKKICVWTKGDYEAAQDTRSPDGDQWWYSLHYKGRWVGDFPTQAEFKKAAKKGTLPLDHEEEVELEELRRSRAWKKYLKEVNKRLRRERA